VVTAPAIPRPQAVASAALFPNNSSWRCCKQISVAADAAMASCPLKKLTLSFIPEGRSRPTKWVLAVVRTPIKVSTSASRTNRKCA